MVDPVKPASRAGGLLCAVGVLFIWAAFIDAARLGATLGLGPLDMLALRHGGAFLAALPLLARAGWPRLPLRRMAVLLATAAFAFPLLAYAGFRTAPAAHGGVMLPGMLPFVSALVMRLALGEAFSRRRLAALGLTAAGIALLAWDTFGAGGAARPDAWQGDLLLLAGIVCWALYMLAVRVWRIAALQATLAVCLGAAPVTVPLWCAAWWLRGDGAPPVPAATLAGQALMQGAFAVLAANYLFTRAMNALGPAALTTITALVPGVAALAAWPVLGERLGPAGLAGIALVACALLPGLPARRDACVDSLRATP